MSQTLITAQPDTWAIVPSRRPGEGTEAHVLSRVAAWDIRDNFRAVPIVVNGRRPQSDDRRVATCFVASTEEAHRRFDVFIEEWAADVGTRPAEVRDSSVTDERAVLWRLRND